MSQQRLWLCGNSKSFAEIIFMDKQDPVFARQILDYYSTLPPLKNRVFDRHLNLWRSGELFFGEVYGCKISKKPFTLESLAIGKFKKWHYQAEEELRKELDNQIHLHFFDHFRYWAKNSKPYALTMEPYLSPEKAAEVLPMIDNRCNELDLTLAYGTASEWNNHGACWVQITKP